MTNLGGLFQHTTDVENYPAGATIFEEGSHGDTMYVIREGQVDVSYHGKLIETVGEGLPIGEMALIDNEIHSATCIARTDCVLIPVTQKRFLFMVQETPQFAVNIMRIMANRLRKQNALNAEKSDV